MVHEPRPHRILPVDQLPSGSRIPPLRKPLRRGSQMARLLLLGSVPLHGVRPADLPGKPARHRSVRVQTGFRSQVARSNCDANESRDWRIYADFAQVLIRSAALVRPRSDRRGSPKVSTLWTRPPSTCDSRCSRGPSSAGARPPYTGRRQRVALADLCRFRPGLDSHRAALVRRSDRRGSPSKSLRSGLVDLCLSLFPWAKFRRRMKMHTLGSAG